MRAQAANVKLCEFLTLSAIFRAIFVINAVSNSDWPAATNVGARHLLDMCDNGQQQLCPGVRSGG